MLQEFWHYFMATGNVDAYLNFKEYEGECQNIESQVDLTARHE